MGNGYLPGKEFLPIQTLHYHYKWLLRLGDRSAID